MTKNLQGINSSVDEAKDQISGLEYKETKTTQLNNKKKGNEDRVRSL